MAARYVAPRSCEGHNCLGYTFNAALKPVERHVGADAVARLKAELGAKRWIDFFRYPAADVYVLLNCAADELAQKLGSRDAAFVELGETVAKDFFDTAMGKTLLVLIGSPEPARMLAQAANAYRTTVSWGTRTWTSTGPTSGIFAVRGELMPPEYQAHVVLGAVKHVSKRPARVIIKTQAPGDYDFDLSWD